MAADAMEEKPQQVTSWLKNICVDEPNPEFEVNSETIDVLYDLAEYSESSNEDTSLLIEDMKERAAKYEAEATYLQGLLTEGLGLPPGSLSSEGTSYLDVIVNSALALETKDTSLVSFFGAINDMTLELYETELKNRQMEEELEKLKPKITGVLMLEKQLDEDIKMSESLMEERKARSRMQSKSLEFLREKSEDIKVRISAAENELVDRGLDQSLTHESLVKLSEELDRMQEELMSLKKQLESYDDLSPSLPLAKVKVEEAKRELEVLDEELSREVDQMMCESQLFGGQ